MHRILLLLVLGGLDAAVADEGGLTEDAMIATLERDRTVASVAFSGYVCSCQHDRQAALAEIATLYKYARVGGVIDKAAVNEQQQLLREADENIADARAAMKRVRVRLMPCKNPMVAALTHCLDDDNAEVCRDENIARLVRIQRELVTGELTALPTAGQR